MISIACPQCQKRYRLDDKFAGKRAKCKECGQVMEIHASSPLDPLDTPPTPSTPAPTPPPAPIAASPEPSTQPPPATIPAGKPTTIAASRRGSNATADTRPPRPPAANVPGAANVAGGANVPGGAAGNPATGRPFGEAAPTLRGTTSHLEYEISQRPDFSIVSVKIPQGRQLFAEPTAMVSMTPSVNLEAGLKGGIGKTFGRLLGGESLIINTFTAQDGPGEVMFAGGTAGDVAYHRLEGNTLYLQRGAYMLNSDGVDVSGKWQGAKGFFNGEGLVLLKATGTGDIFFNSYGAIIPIDVTDGFIVDTGYIVAFEESLQYRITVLPGLRMAGKIKSFFFGGEGLVCQFTGTGRVWIQTRQVKSFLSWVHAFRPAKSD